MHRELETILLDFDEETTIGKITLDRPDSLNAINQQMREDISEALEVLSELDDEGDTARLSTVVIEGAGGRAFCAGADINEFAGRNPSDYSASDFRDEITEFPTPIIAKIDGYCLGGGLEMACACDFRFASQESELGLPEVDLGLIPGAGGVQFISRLANPSVAKEIAMTGEQIPAEDASEMGIINDWYPSDEFEEKVSSFVNTLSEKPPLSLRAIKDSANISVESGLDASRQYDRRVFSTLLETDDHAAAAAAFTEDRDPEFEGR